MGKAVPALSAALRSQLSVRAALYPSGRGAKWTRGYTGSLHAAARYAALHTPARPPRARARPHTWADVPAHVQRDILWRLPLSAVQACRLAGFGGRDAAWRSEMRAAFVARVAALHGVEAAYVYPGNARRGSGSVSGADGARARFRPVEFAAMGRLFIFAGGGARGVPEGIGEMRGLERLEVLGDVVRTLPAGLVMCAGLRQLGLRGHGFVALPRVVLGLRKLKVLSLSMCALLEALPDDIGDSLPQLSRLEVEGCTLLKALPDSLLARLEKSGYKVPLVVTVSLFRAGYLDELLCAKRFPKLRLKMAAVAPAIFMP